VGEGFSITGIKLEVKAKVPGIDDETFQKLAEATKVGCPVARALSPSVKLELNASLV
jgi:osmotically inducible protein OsmC